MTNAEQKQAVWKALQSNGLTDSATHAGQIAARLGDRISKAATQKGRGEWTLWEEGK